MRDATSTHLLSVTQEKFKVDWFRYTIYLSEEKDFMDQGIDELCGPGQ